MDDGRGINIKNIREIALQKGILQNNENLSKEHILQCLFKPEFSTG